MPSAATTEASQAALAQPVDKGTAASRRTGRQTSSELAFLARALKAPALLDAADRLAERARKESWTHAEYLVACLQREGSARESHGGEPSSHPTMAHPKPRRTS
ncbi:P-loop NTPase family protein [Streptomyces malaysiensis]|uniref:hypothetical protein n=1 Tax=Streptomyces malaysiensis TaxID=92644 RepID=UPI00370F8784